MKEKIFCHFNLLKGDEKDVKEFFNSIQNTDRKFLYRVFPSKSEYDFILWTAKKLENQDTIYNFMNYYSEKFYNYKNKIESREIFWGYTKPSIYTKGKSLQEIDVFSKRKKYLIVYPFLKTSEWYLLNMETRQKMMNEHIRVGRKYQEVDQLLLYSFGIQDQEFVVVYETEDLIYFSELVFELRSTEVRKYTLRDTPIIVGFYLE